MDIVLYTAHEYYIVYGIHYIWVVLHADEDGVVLRVIIRVTLATINRADE